MTHSTTLTLANMCSKSVFCLDLASKTNSYLNSTVDFNCQSQSYDSLHTCATSVVGTPLVAALTSVSMILRHYIDVVFFFVVLNWCNWVCRIDIQFVSNTLVKFRRCILEMVDHFQPSG